MADRLMPSAAPDSLPRPLQPLARWAVLCAAFAGLLFDGFELGFDRGVELMWLHVDGLICTIYMRAMLGGACKGVKEAAVQQSSCAAGLRRRDCVLNDRLLA